MRREEWPFALFMFTYAFLVIGTFWILKPLKKGLFIEHYDTRGFALAGWHFEAAEAELLAKVLNMGVAVVAVAVFTWLVHRFRRERLTTILMFFFILGDLAYAQLLGKPGPGTVWSFYLFGDLFSTLMVATFFASLNDSVTPESAKRLYGFVGLGAVLGGVVGSSVLGVFIASLKAPTWLYACAVIGAVIVAVAVAAGRLVRPGEGGGAARATPAADTPRPNPAIEGAALVLRSPYLLSIAAIVGFYEIVSTTMDFQFTSAVAHFLNGDAIGAHLSRVFAVTNVASMLVQFFVTPAVMQTWGLGVALLILPAATGAGSMAFLALPSLWVGSLLNTADNAFSYSINQSAKEALYVPTSEDEKYKAKAFIDMFIQRAAKAVAVGVSLAIGLWFQNFSSVRWLSLVTLVLVAAWVVAARYAGRGYPDETSSARPGRRAA